MRTLAWLWIGLVGCDSTVTRIGPGSNSDAAFDSDDTAGEGGAAPDACDKRSFDGSCVRFSGTAWDPVSVAQACGDGVLVQVCPESDLGGCLKDQGYPLEFVEWYYQGAYYDLNSLSDLQANCEVNFGVWQ